MVAENNDMSFFELFQYCLGSGLGTIGDFSSEQLLHDPFAMLKHIATIQCNIATMLQRCVVLKVVVANRLA